jgi:ABC-type molybdate transport system substrate-binding protein
MDADNKEIRGDHSMRMIGKTVPLAAMLLALADMAAAAEIRVLSVDRVEAAIRTLAVEFGKETGHRVIFNVGSPEAVMEKIKAGEIHDAVIVSEPAMDQLDADGLVNPESRVPLASTSPRVPAPGDAPPSPPSALEKFEGALMSEGSVPLEARALIEFFVGPEARRAWLAAELEPLQDQ